MRESRKNINVNTIIEWHIDSSSDERDYKTLKEK